MIDQIARLLPNFKGKRRILNAFLKNKITNARDILIKGKHHCTYLLPNLQESVSFEIFTNGEYEPETIEFISNHLPIHGVFIDVGCNIGTISIPLAKKRKDLKIYSIEASQRVYNYFVRNIELNKIKNITPIKAALLDREGVEMHFYSPDLKFGKGSFSRNFVSGGEPITTSTLSQIFNMYNIQSVNFLKVDVEGYESKVFQGAHEFLKFNDVNILFEFADWAESTALNCQVGDAQALLKQLNYNLFDFDNNLSPIVGIQKHSGMILARKP